jgi:hypothetical protein
MKIKRSQPPTATAYAHRTGDVKLDLNKDQRAELGAIALASQELVLSIEALLPVVIGPNWVILKIVNRLTPDISSKITWMRDGIDQMPALDHANNTLREQIKDALKNADIFLGVRGVIIHSVIFNAPHSIATNRSKRSDKPQEISLAIEALEYVYNQLVATREEIDHAAAIIKTHRESMIAEPDQKRSQLSTELQALIGQFQVLRAKRVAISSPSGFPSESELREGVRRANEATAASQMGWFVPWDQPTRQQPPRQPFADQSWVPGPPDPEKKED